MQVDLSGLRAREPASDTDTAVVDGLKARSMHNFLNTPDGAVFADFRPLVITFG